MPKTKILFVRHGETLWNLEERMQGLKNSPLTETGIHQTELLAQTSINYCYTSDLERARQTATILIGKREITTIFEPALRELINQPLADLWSNGILAPQV